MTTETRPKETGGKPPPECTRAGRRLDRLLLLFLAIAAAANFWVVRDYVFEDAYITFRYAANLAQGHGFVFQAGERVFGSSTPLWTLLLAACGQLGSDIPAAGKMIFCAALSACGYFGWRLLARRGAPLAGTCFAVAAVGGAGGILPFAGMETALHLALFFLAFLLADGEKPRALGVVLGLICLNRYDGVLLAAAVLAVSWLRERRLPWRAAAVAGGLFGAWILFAWFYFGSPLPNTLAAKASDVPFFEYLGAGFLQQARQILLPLHWLWPATARNDFLLPALVLGALPLARWILRARSSPARLVPGDPGLAAAALAGLLLWLGYAFVGPPLAHTWYLIPGAYCALLLALAGWGELPWRRPARAGALLPLLLLGVALLLLPALKKSQAAAMSAVAFGQDRIAAYRELAAWVAQHGLRDTTVLTLEPGYLTYLSGQRAIDAAGLVSPGIHFHGPAGRRQDFGELIRKYRPEMVVPSAALLGADPASFGYQVAFTPLPGRQLWLRHDVYQAHLDDLYDAWQRGAYAPPRAAGSHPLAIDFGDPEPPFLLRRARLQKVRGLTFAGEPWRRRVLNSRGAAGEAAAWSESFLVDFDQLEFLFAGSHPEATVARLYVDGLLAWQQGGAAGAAAGPEAIAPLEKIVLPVHGWRGHLARLCFLSAAAGQHFFAADRIRSRRWERQRVLDDFESGFYDPAVWAETFGDAPADNRELAGRCGLPCVQGRGAASSLELAGPRRLRSRPFLVDHDRLAFTLFDLGDARTRVELTVAGKAEIVFHGGASGKILLFDWDLARYQGQNAVLSIYDDDPAAGDGGSIGIDSIVLHDPAGNGDSP